MVYLKNNSELQEVYIPKMKHDADDVKTPYEIGYEDGRADQKNEDVSKLEDIFIDKNGTYIPNFGYKKVEVNCEGGPLEEKSVAIDGDVTEITPSEGFYGIGKAVIDATAYGNTKKEEQKSEDEGKLTTKEITENGEYKADYGFSSVTVNVDADPKLQEKSVYLKTEDDERQTVTPDEGYDGLSSVYVDALELSIYRYQAGMQQAKELITEKTYALGENEDSAFIEPDLGMWGMSSVNLNATAYGNAKFAAGKAEQKSEDDAKLSTLTATKNGNYDADYGYSSVTVNLPLEEKSVVLTATTQEIVPTSSSFEYLQTNGTAYFKTNVAVSSVTKVEIDYFYLPVQNGVGVTHRQLLCAGDMVRIADDANGSFYFKWGGADRYKINYNNEGINHIEGSLVFSTTGLTINGETVATYEEAKNSLLDTFGIFANMLGGDRISNANTKIGRVKFYNGDTLIKDLQPVEVNGVGKYYDAVGGTYLNVSKGSVTYNKEGTTYEGMSKVTVDASQLVSEAKQEGVDYANNCLVVGVSYTMTECSGLVGMGSKLSCFCDYFGNSLTGKYLSVYENEDCTKFTYRFKYSTSEGFCTLSGSGIAGHTKLKEISFPTVFFVGDSTLSGCTSLESVTFGFHLQSLGSGVFSGDTALTSITFKGKTAPSCTSASFEGAADNVVVYYPQGADYSSVASVIPSTWTIQEMQ